MIQALLRRTLAASIVLGSAAVHAQGCWSPGATGMTFTAVSPDRATDATGSAQLTCQSVSRPGYVRYCVYVGDGGPIAGIAPRWLTNYNGSRMAYDLYADAARTQIIGPPPGGGGFPVYTGTLALPGSFLSTTVSIPVYGRVPAGQTLPPTVPYQSQISNTSIAWAYGASGYPASCTSGDATGSTSFYFGVTATMASGCRISLASDLDFGAVTGLPAAVDGSSIIVVRCPLGTPWSLALDDGLHAAAGARRMVSAAGQVLPYELYQDPGRSQRWGTAGVSLVTGTGAGETVPQTAPVYGRVPMLPSAKPGVYTDNVTAILTY